ncbi:unnamed protein product [Polarella glacialis]|nr:unnamed protein product [Polarella glacialis]
MAAHLEKVMCLASGSLLAGDSKNLLIEIYKEETSKICLAEASSKNIEIQVEAELEDGWRDVWHCTLLPDDSSKPLRLPVAKRWSDAHRSISELAVGFDVLVGDGWQELDAKTSPSDLGWSAGGAPLRLLAWPAEPSEPSAKKLKTEAPFSVRGAAPKAAPKASLAAIRGAAPKAAPKANARSGLILNGIGEHEPIEFTQAHSKKTGSASWTRYEKYKVAKTIREALTLGAARGDLKVDLEKGLCKKAA